MWIWICNIFSHSPVFRIGGDEFVVILTGQNFGDRDKLVDEFYRQLNDYYENEELEPWERISAALGIAIYDPEVDAGIDSVFQRADSAMYKKKHEMKAEREKN